MENLENVENSGASKKEVHENAKNQEKKIKKRKTVTREDMLRYMSRFQFKKQRPILPRTYANRNKLTTARLVATKESEIKKPVISNSVKARIDSDLDYLLQNQKVIPIRVKAPESYFSLKIRKPKQAAGCNKKSAGKKAAVNKGNASSDGETVNSDQSAVFFKKPANYKRIKPISSSTSSIPQNVETATCASQKDQSAHAFSFQPPNASDLSEQHDTIFEKHVRNVQADDSSKRIPKSAHERKKTVSKAPSQSDHGSMFTLNSFENQFMAGCQSQSPSVSKQHCGNDATFSITFGSPKSSIASKDQPERVQTQKDTSGAEAKNNGNSSSFFQKPAGNYKRTKPISPSSTSSIHQNIETPKCVPQYNQPANTFNFTDDPSMSFSKSTHRQNSCSKASSRSDHIECIDPNSFKLLDLTPSVSKQHRENHTPFSLSFVSPKSFISSNDRSKRVPARKKSNHNRIGDNSHLKTQSSDQSRGYHKSRKSKRPVWNHLPTPFTIGSDSQYDYHTVHGQIRAGYGNEAPSLSGISSEFHKRSTNSEFDARQKGWSIDEPKYTEPPSVSSSRFEYPTFSRQRQTKPKSLVMNTDRMETYAMRSSSSGRTTTRTRIMSKSLSRIGENPFMEQIIIQRTKYKKPN